MRGQNGVFLASKGGHNDESHNHNDVGTFILFYDEQPVFVDAGVGTYTRKTFSPERYDIWTMQSNYHNLPVINGYPQRAGKQYKSSEVEFDPDQSSFSLDLSKAYPRQAKIEKWTRRYRINQNQQIQITDDFSLKNPEQPNQINFLTALKPVIDDSDNIKIPLNSNSVSLSFNKAKLKPSIKVINIEDRRLEHVWGKRLYQVSFTAKQLTTKDQYKFFISNP